jgi:hypothetical protein
MQKKNKKCQTKRTTAPICRPETETFIGSTALGNINQLCPIERSYVPRKIGPANRRIPNEAIMLLKTKASHKKTNPCSGSKLGRHRSGNNILCVSRF